MPQDPRPEVSSVAVGGGKDRGPLLWILLAVLLLVVLLALLLGSCGSDDEDDSSATVPTPTATTPSTPEPTTPTAPEPTTPSATTPDPTASAQAPDPGTLVSGTTSLLENGGDAIGDEIGQPVTGEQLTVVGISESSFLVGTDEIRQYVEFGDPVGANEPDKPLPEVGDVVSLTGEVRPAPAEPGRTLKLTEANAKLVSERGAYVNADSVTTR